MTLLSEWRFGILCLLASELLGRDEDDRDDEAPRVDNVVQLRVL